MGLKVIGAGFGRTGTASLKLALEKLLGGPCHHMSEVLGNAGQVDMWLDAAAGKPDWDAIFDGYVATVDFPTSFYWRELADHYPEAKIVLSVRDPERWFESTQETIFSPRLGELSADTKWSRMAEATIGAHFPCPQDDREGMVAAFNAHADAVKAAFGPDRLLVFEARQGWAPLCELLGVPEPDEPYPHINSKAEFEAIFELLQTPMGAKMMNGEGAGGVSVHDEAFKSS